MRLRILILAGCAAVISGTSQGQSLRDRWAIINPILHPGESGARSAQRAEAGEKCGLGITFAVLREWDRLSGAQRSAAARALQAPVRQKSRSIGHFQIFYDTSTTDTPTLLDANHQPIPGTYETFVDSAGRVFNDVWNKEIESLGYAAPPLEANGLYRIYVSNLGSGLYGLTQADPPVPINSGTPPRYRTYVEIDHDFRFVYGPSRGMPGLKVTAAHEFHHAIQLGSYGSWPDDRYFYEITSTWMEDVVYTGVNDYYQYLSNDPSQSTQFSHPERRFTLSDQSIEYSRSVWGKYVEKRFSPLVMRTTWENMAHEASVPALNDALLASSSSLREAFLEFAFWNSTTGPASDTVAYYTEGRNYPPVRQRPLIQYTPPGRSFTDSTEALSTVYHPVLLGASQLLVTVSNINTDAAYAGGSFTFTYDMQDEGDGTYVRIPEGIFVKLYVADPENWNSPQTGPALVSGVSVYPNPFVAGRSRSVKFRLPPTSEPAATLTVFGSDIDRVYSGELPVILSPILGPRIEWNGVGDDNSSVPSGIYFYFITLGKNEYKGKFSIIHN